jgi:hypothetical protein
VPLMKKMVLYGGESDEVVCFDPDSSSWERPVFDPEEPGQGKPPPQRFGMTMTALDNEKAVVIGGLKPDVGGEEAPTEFFNDVHVLLCEKGKWKWHNTGEIPGTPLQARGKHAACLIPVGKKVVVFGGMPADYGKGGDLLDDTSVLAAQNVAKMDRFHLHKLVEEVIVDKAEEHGEKGTPVTEPAKDDVPKEGQEGENDENEGEAERQGEPNAQDEKTFTIPAMNEVPGKRHSHGMTSIEGQIFCFGGISKIEGKEYPNNSVMSFSPAFVLLLAGLLLRWPCMSCSVCDCDLPTAGMVVWAHDIAWQVCVGEFVLAGKTLSKGDSVKWKQLNTHGDVPCPRKDFSVTSLDGKVIVQGGIDYEGNLLDDIYALDPHTGKWTTMYRSDSMVRFVCVALTSHHLTNFKGMHCPIPTHRLACSGNIISTRCPALWESA